MSLEIMVISNAISIVSVAIISATSLYGYFKIESRTLLFQGIAFILVTIGLVSSFFTPYTGFYFEGIGFLIFGLEHIKTVKEEIAPLIIIPYVAGGTIAIFFALYAGIETLLYYQRTKRGVNLIVGTGLILVAISILLQMTSQFSSAGYVIQALGYLVMLSSLVR
ncbi:MAG: hypothetical protein ACP5LW_02075 [Nitrososphaeria archaeon]